MEHGFPLLHFQPRVLSDFLIFTDMKDEASYFNEFSFCISLFRHVLCFAYTEHLFCCVRAVCVSFPVGVSFAHLFLLGCWPSHWCVGRIAYFWPSQDEFVGLNNSYLLTGSVPWNSSRNWKVPCGSSRCWRSDVPAQSRRLCQNPPLCPRPACHMSRRLCQPSCFWCTGPGMGVWRKQGTQLARCIINKKEHRFIF